MELLWLPLAGRNMNKKKKLVMTLTYGLEDNDKNF
jgi:hypothetical protein